MRNHASIETFLSPAEARAFYDRFGAKQDRQGFYEAAAINALIRHGSFREARSVVEFGCGTGALAARLLARELPTDASYRGFDISNTMVELAKNRTAGFRDRATVERTEGGPELPASSATFDRFVSCYVVDLPPPEDIDAVLTEAQRILEPGGLLCVASLGIGSTLPSRLVSGLWERIHQWNPRIVGGCRPLRLAPLLRGDVWVIEHRAVIARFGIPSEIVVARLRARSRSVSDEPR